MRINDKKRGKAVIRELARREGASPADLRREMQVVIDDAWANKTQESSVAWARYFPDGKKPTVEEFIVRLGDVAREIKAMKGGK